MRACVLVPDGSDHSRLDANSTRFARSPDGIELHSAHGYLIDQFLQSSSNLRTDHYGGSIENRARFLFQILDRVLQDLPPSKVAVRLSPFADAAVSDSNPVELFTYVLTKLDAYGLAYIQITEPDYARSLTSVDGPPHKDSKLNVFNGILKRTPVMKTGGYDKTSAEECLREGRAQLVGFGRYVFHLRARRFARCWVTPTTPFRSLL